MSETTGPGQQLTDHLPNVATPEIAELRATSRQLVRRLGLLSEEGLIEGISPAETHLMLELANQGALGQGDLAERLRIDKSNVSRAVRRLLDRGKLVRSPVETDGRARTVELSEAGRADVAAVDHDADQWFGQTLALLPAATQTELRRSLNSYVSALARLERLRHLRVRPLSPTDDVELARLLLEVRREFELERIAPSILSPEEENCSQLYQTSGHEYWVLEDTHGLVGGGGFASIEARASRGCEIQRLYLRRRIRGAGAGRLLVQHLLKRAKTCGYGYAYVETVGKLHAAHATYRSCGFEDREQPLAGGCHNFVDQSFERTL